MPAERMPVSGSRKKTVTLSLKDLRRGRRGVCVDQSQRAGQHRCG